MRVLLTGASGMVGQNIIRAIENQNFELIAPRRNELDLLDGIAVSHYVKSQKPDVIVHAAGRVGGIQANLASPVAFLSDNLEMGRNVVLAARDAAVKNLLNLGSSCMYPRDRRGSLREEDVLSGPLEPTNEGYALAKCAIARLCSFVSREDESLRYRTIIPCNLYGSYDKFDPAVSHLVPAALRKVHLAKTSGERSVSIWGDGTARREFMYAGDLADAILFAVLNFDRLPDTMNVGVGSDYSVLQYYQAAAEAVGYTGEFVFERDRPVGMARKLLNIDRQLAFGWTATTTLSKGLEKTYEYYLSTWSIK